jgi:hypothetical protein
MGVADELYAELKPDLAAVADPLFEMSEHLLRKHGRFLPHGAVLSEQGEVRLVTAAPGLNRRLTNSIEVLPVLHEGLRQECREASIKAVGVAENVTVTLEGERTTQAIKVLFEHMRGLTVALYLPFEKRLLRGYRFGASFSVAANPEVKPWSGGQATGH